MEPPEIEHQVTPDETRQLPDLDERRIERSLNPGPVIRGTDAVSSVRTFWDTSSEGGYRLKSGEASDLHLPRPNRSGWTSTCGCPSSPTEGDQRCPRIGAG